MNITTEQNPIIHSFLSIQSNKQLLEQAMYYPTAQNKQKLNQAFKLFFLEARFTSYIASLIHFSAINYDKKNRLYKDRYQLIVDQNRDSDHASASIFPADTDTYHFVEQSWQQVMTEKRMYEAIEQLTSREQSILCYLYIYEMTEKEISTKLQVTQQAISKTKRLALKKLQTYLQCLD
ncbi:sigma-70 family RNA polymerase sigma factor [Paenibacillus kyungheensis]|uniref:Sigma-70 family RNA polymerase sigma factor n=1 Tax=Paenibacillus kyungheensis TaxID=1452732 RepID=A0AAX3M0A0_9BACL|nr:sigma-70 family RNA polymerase sigma factor [Paenibacillus kyungheensis]WCT55625.1 sigma-70 family RNA polymerase sigma factor [Paenibacillus kyungheensis]